VRDHISPEKGLMTSEGEKLGIARADPD